MNVTEKHRRLTLLRTAKKALLRKDSFFVCVALDGAADTLRGEAYDNLAVTMREEIMDSLEGCATVWEWLMERAGIPEADIDSSNIHTYRIQWVSHMIKTLQSQ